MTDRTDYAHVTEVISCLRNEGLENWRGKVGNRLANKVMKLAAQEGTALHGYMEARLSGQVPTAGEVSDLQETLRAGADKWIGLNETKGIRLEEQVWDDELRVAGRVDAILGNEVLDWKTSKTLKMEHQLQVTAYLGLLKMWNGTGRLVRFDHVVPNFVEVRFRFRDELWDAFKGLAKFYTEWRRFNADVADGEISAD